MNRARDKMKEEVREGGGEGGQGEEERGGEGKREE